jgi:heme-degrading monooxygenase HmoA
MKDAHSVAGAWYITCKRVSGVKGAVMARVGQPFTCGIWTVRDGSQEEFVTRWTVLVNSAEALPGSEFFLLIQDRADAHRFISFGAWDEWETADAWRASEAFADAMRACRELCEDFRPNDSTLRVAIGT